MQIGLQLPVPRRGVSPAECVNVAVEAERMGFHSVWISEHLLTPRELRSKYPYTADGSYGSDVNSSWPDPVGVLGVLAGATRTITLGTAVLVPGYRHPIPLAKSLAAIDLYAGGRLLLGLGVGWMEEEYEAVGLDPRRRGARLEEHLTAMRAIWRDGICSFDGEFYSWPESSFLPKPPREDIPVIFGGHADAVLRRVARMADGWAISSMLAGGGSLEDRLRRVGTDYYREGLDRLRAHCEREGRPFDSLTNLVTRPLVLFEDEPPPKDRPLLYGGPHEILADIELLSSLGLKILNAAVYNRSGGGLAGALRSCERLAETVLQPAASL